MSNPVKELLEGVALALLVYVTVSSVVPLLVAPAYAQSAPIFSATLIASTGNPVRRQYASIIAANLRSVGIDARLFYINFDVLSNRLFFSSTKQGNSFDQGGYDIGFIGWGFTSPVPDFRTNFDGRPAYLAPSGQNYALYNNPELNAVWDQLYATTDPAQQKSLDDKAQEIIFRDKPYNYVYEPTDAIPVNSKWAAWGSKGIYSEVTFPDVQHWSGGNQLVFAEASNVFPSNNVNPVTTPSSNNFYSLYILGDICSSGAGLQDIDARTLQFYPGLATNITHSKDNLDWTIQIRHGALWQDGVEITADDFVFTQYLLTNAGANNVGLGSNIQYLGNYVSFTYNDGTTKVDDNSAGATHITGTWKALDKYTFTFHMPAVYAFTGQTFAAISPLPKHILEQMDPKTIDSSDYSTAAKPHTYTWDAQKYGGSGSYTAVGPVCAGPYYLANYDFTANVATLKKFTNYWNASGLQALGQFTVDTFKVAWIESKDAAIAALKNGEVDVLDYNYQLAADESTLRATGATIVHQNELGWQELGFNMMSPIFGTGVNTPAGKADPTKAATAALQIRTAISHLIPREKIIHDLLLGVGTPLATWIGPGWGIWYDPNLKPDTYDVSTAVSELQAAGYSVNFTPPAPIAIGGTPMLGQSVTVSGTSQISHEMIIIQQSADGGKTWKPIAAGVADNSSRYSVSVQGPPVFGTSWYAANFTGYAVGNETLARRPITPSLVNQYIKGGLTAGNRRLIAQKLSDPITATSTTNDTLVVLVPIIIVVAVGALLARNRKKKTSSQTQA
ncbi:MAG: ABC transporter substrate-binding protein [Candidatus Bathyarchaeia archaeon]|jgi:ABC-type transport system substrate-binding protein